jgi:hypothetical protein
MNKITFIASLLVTAGASVAVSHYAFNMTMQTTCPTSVIASETSQYPSSMFATQPIPKTFKSYQ